MGRVRFCGRCRVRLAGGKGALLRLPKRRDEIRIHIPIRISDAVNQGALQLIGEDRSRCEFGAESEAVVRVRQPCFPTVQRDRGSRGTRTTVSAQHPDRANHR